MRVEFKPLVPVNPPREIVLTLTEEEYVLLGVFANYYALLAAARPGHVAAKRLSDYIQSNHRPFLAIYPFTDAFKFKENE